MSDYLECGHPKACWQKHEWKQYEYCAACERGGWVKPSEGLPERHCWRDGL